MKSETSRSTNVRAPMPTAVAPVISHSRPVQRSGAVRTWRVSSRTNLGYCHDRSGSVQGGSPTASTGGSFGGTSRVSKRPPEDGAEGPAGDGADGFEGCASAATGREE